MNAVAPAVVLLVALAGCSRLSPEQRFIEDAAAALGGAERLRSAQTIVMEGHGTVGNLGQDLTWEASGQKFELSDYRRAVDLTGGRSRTELTRTPTFLYFLGPRPQRQEFGVDGEVAYSMSVTGTASRSSPALTADRRADFYHHPLTIVRALLEPGAHIESVEASGAGRTARVQVAGLRFRLTIDQDGVPESVASESTHPNLGDVTIETSFANYQEFDGLSLPVRLTTKTDAWITTEMRIERYIVNGDPRSVRAPLSVTSSPAPPAAPAVEVVDVAPGVWLLAGQSHHSALIEFADHLTLIEAPQSEARTRAVIEKARELVPDKPLTELVITHHHFDHTAGLRMAIAEGLTIITHAGNAPFVHEMSERRHTRQPDALQRAPRALQLEVVEDRRVLSDRAQTLELYAIDGDPHADALLMAYLPSERVLIEADAFTPGGRYHPYAANLLRIIQQRQLRVDRIVPLHGTVVTYQQFLKAVQSQ